MRTDLQNITDKDLIQRDDTELFQLAFQALLADRLDIRDRCVKVLERRNAARQEFAVQVAQAAKPYFTEH